MNLDKVEQQLFYPERISSKALRFVLGELAMHNSMNEEERVEAIIAKIQYQLRLRQGQGED